MDGITCNLFISSKIGLNVAELSDLNSLRESKLCL